MSTPGWLSGRRWSSPVRVRPVAANCFQPRDVAPIITLRAIGPTTLRGRPLHERCLSPLLPSPRPQLNLTIIVSSIQRREMSPVDVA